MSTTIGVDPGTSGAVRLLSDDGAVEAFDVPVLKFKIGKSIKTRLDLVAFSDLLTALVAFGPSVVVIEDVGGLPGQSAPAAFSFGFTCGAMTMCLAAAGIPYVKVTPGVWKKRFRLTSDKDHCRLVAGQLLPAGRHLWARKKDDGRAEAALLALYGRSYHETQGQAAST